MGGDSMSGKKSSSLTPIWSVLQDIKGIGSISRKSFEGRLPTYSRSKSHSAVSDSRMSFVVGECNQRSKWANMPPELLRDVIQRIEASEDAWPSRKNVVVCSSVCRNWRSITKETVKTLEQSGRLTFPVSLKQPGPRDTTVQCFLKRDRATSTYHLYLGLSPNAIENGKFMLAARKFRRASGTDYIISLDRDDFSRGSNTYVGKLRSNFMGTKFTLYDSCPPHDGAVASTNRAGRRILSKQVSPRVPAGSYNIAHIAYELNVLGTRGPRRMECTIHSIPASAMEPGGSAPTPLEHANFLETSAASVLSVSIGKSKVSDCNGLEPGFLNKSRPLILKNKPPRWHDQLQCWCLNFRGRVTVASVKNFQLVAASDIVPPAQQNSGGSDPDNVILQFGKIGKDMFTMDYRYPLSAFQAFAISLSSFDTKDSLHCTYALMF